MNRGAAAGLEMPAGLEMTVGVEIAAGLERAGAGLKISAGFACGTCGFAGVMTNGFGCAAVVGVICFSSGFGFGASQPNIDCFGFGTAAPAGFGAITTGFGKSEVAVGRGGDGETTGAAG